MQGQIGRYFDSTIETPARSVFPAVIHMQFNDTKAEPDATRNYEGGEAFDPDSPELGLYKLTINNLLEDTFYREDDAALAELRAQFDTVADSNPEFALKLAAYAREEMYLRDVSQVLLTLAAHDERTKGYVRDYATQVMQRADEPATVVAIHDTLFGGTLPKPLKKGINDALHEFDQYQFSKYDTDRREVNLRDVINRTHPAPRDEEHDELFERLIHGSLSDYPDVVPLEPPETWETVISERGNTSEAWRDVLPRMGLFAKIRNVRNMRECGLSGSEIFADEDMDHVRNAKLYPFRFYQSYKAVKDAGLADEETEMWLSDAIDVSAENLPDDLGDTYVAVDLSGSMDSPLSANSTLTYKEIGALFGATLMAKGATVGGFGDSHKIVRTHYDTPTLQRLEAIMGIDREVGNSTNGWKAIRDLRQAGESVARIVVFTDMQIWDSSGGLFGSRNDNTVRDEFDAYRDSVNPETTLYMIDLSSYGDLVTPEGFEGVYNVSGWNERVLDFIQYAETPGQIIDAIEAEYGD